MNKLKTCLSYDDVLLVPQYSDIDSRKTVDISSLMGKHKFRFPIIASPMDTITEDEMVSSFSSMGGLALVHRYNNLFELGEILDNVFQENVNARLGAAVGVKDYMDRVKLLVDHFQIPIICVDVAHGHHQMVERTIKEILDYCGDRICLIAGNVATREGFDFLAKAGANAARVGLGGGSICSTRINTGHGVPTLQSVFDCAESDYSNTVAIIADGGCKDAGDCVKALAAGASFVMAGSLLAGTIETPGEIIKTNKGYFKKYRGMASYSAQKNNKQVYSVEGVSTLVPYRDSVINVIRDLEERIKSGFTYSGARNLQELQNKAIFVRQTMAGMKESSPHILDK